MKRLILFLLILSMPLSCTAQSLKVHKSRPKRRKLTLGQKKRVGRVRKIVRSANVARKRRLLLNKKSTAFKMHRLRRLLVKPNASAAAISRAYKNLLAGLSRKEVILVTEAIVLDFRLKTRSRFYDELGIDKIEEKQETIRNERQEYQTSFENFDQKVNQLFSLLSTVLKSMKETNSGTNRNTL